MMKQSRQFDISRKSIDYCTALYSVMVVLRPLL
ncbi:hypothetical protein C7476_1207 [Phyllobacterium bourgognense]|uniref:Uncharacterized protein n=1 Tax=Phyllobacterium bourgognense TaxID=314236 RepID=A0A368YH13_9HYPH|nr:hypothetical protein C7476_1207 [Phyllobacterium bourgognense]